MSRDFWMVEGGDQFGRIVSIREKKWYAIDVAQSVADNLNKRKFKNLYWMVTRYQEGERETSRARKATIRPHIKSRFEEVK